MKLTINPAKINSFRLSVNKTSKRGFYIKTIVFVSLFINCQFPEISSKNKMLENQCVPFDFRTEDFINPSSKYGPFTRWWWPGNDVTTEELKREVQLFSKNKFAGVEIQAFTVGINPVGKRLDKVYGWDTPSFYENVQAVMKEALKTGLTVDLNAGSGWPLGGSFLKPEESLLTLDAADTIVSGGAKLNISVPVLKNDYSQLLRGEKIVYNKINLSMAKILAITAAKVLKTENGKVHLDPASTTLLNDHVYSGKIQWKVPQGGQWQIIAFYSLPDGEKPNYIADQKICWVTDHLDSNAVKKSYEYLFGERTGLPRFYGNPFRAIFNDSKEFIAHRHISKEFIEYFKSRRGYDISPWLGVNIIPGYNNAYSFGRDTTSSYVFSSEDWRLRYDYNLTISELYMQHFLNTSRKWMEHRGLLHRAQEYGIRIDVIGASGLASIPEAEQLSAGGSEGFVKLVTSGAHLYNKPIVSQESFVFSNKAGMTTPEKIKVFVNKSFAAGINQIVYHGTSYKYQTGEYGVEGWQAWSSHFRPFNYASIFNESSNYWKYMKEINTFIARSQYILRSGEPKADVLIYFPFIDIEPSQMYRNPEETVINGDIKNNQLKVSNPTVIQRWFMDAWPMINKLEAMGITWDYVNDESLLTADIHNNFIKIRGNDYKGLIISNVPYIQSEVTKRLDTLSAKGARLFIYGNCPSKQPGYLNYGQNDLRITQYFKCIMSHRNVFQTASLDKFEEGVKTLKGPIKFNQKYNFIRQIQREMSDGSRIHFFWNRSDQVKSISLTLNKDFKISYWLNAEDGSIIKNEGEAVAFLLQPYSSIILYASVKKTIPDKSLSQIPTAFSSSKKILEIKKWNIKAGEQSLTDSGLFDWRTNDQFKYLSSVGTYTSSFTIDLKKNRTYFLKMNNVYFTAEIFINDKLADKKIWPPYCTDITSFLKKDVNTIKILVTPSNRNFFVGQGVNGNTQYSNFKNSANTLMPAGLGGPVIIAERTMVNK